MKITADTNVLLRFMLSDDDGQQSIAGETLRTTEVVAISTHAVCEFAWVMSSAYGASRIDIAAAIRILMQLDNVVIDLSAIEAGLKFLDAGGDFADGIIAHAGRWIGGETFVSFDKKAVRLAEQHGYAAKRLR